MAKLALPQVAVPRIERPSALTVPLQVTFGVPIPAALPLTESWLLLNWPLRSEKLGEETLIWLPLWLMETVSRTPLAVLTLQVDPCQAKDPPS